MNMVKDFQILYWKWNKKMNIKEFKKKYKKKNKDIAEYCGVKLQTVDSWTAGSKNPSNSAKILLEHFKLFCECEENLKGDNDTPCQPNNCKNCKAYPCSIPQN